MAEKEILKSHGSGRGLKILLILMLMPAIIIAPVMMFFSPIWNIAGLVIVVICVWIVLFVVHIYRKDAPREIGDRMVELDRTGITLFIEKERAWTVNWDDIAEVRFREGDKYGQYSEYRDLELVITDGQKKEHVLSEFDDLERNTLQELFCALQERLKGKNVRFGSVEKMNRQDGP